MKGHDLKPWIFMKNMVQIKNELRESIVDSALELWRMSLGNSQMDRQTGALLLDFCLESTSSMNGEKWSNPLE